jgi:lipopolysaccharide transport system permease protein
VRDTIRHRAPQVITVEPTRGWLGINLRELWDYRDLLFFLSWRDISVRYKQTALGAVWVILQPFLTMVVFTFIFGKLANISSEGAPYPIFCFAALLPWQYFSTTLNSSANSLVNNANLLSKVYFPRLLIPLSTLFPTLVDFAISFLVLLGLLFHYRFALTWNALWLPAFLILLMTTVFGIGLWFAALNIHYRDIRYIVPFIMQFGMFVSPVVYPSSVVPQRWQAVYAVNPMVGVIEGFRWALLGKEVLPGKMIAISTAVAMLVLLGGIFYFRRAEKNFADIV